MARGPPLPAALLAVNDHAIATRPPPGADPLRGDARVGCCMTDAASLTAESIDYSAMKQTAAAALRVQGSEQVEMNPPTRDCRVGTLEGRAVTHLPHWHEPPGKP